MFVKCSAMSLQTIKKKNGPLEDGFLEVRQLGSAIFKERLLEPVFDIFGINQNKKL